MDVFDQSMETHLDHFDIFIKCPTKFAISNSIQQEKKNLPQVFVLYIRDAFTEHKVFVTHMVGPTNLPIETNVALSEQSVNQFPWIPIIFSLIMTTIVLIIFLVVAIYISRIKIVTPDDVFKYSAVTFINKEHERLNSTSSATNNVKPISRKIKCVLLTLYFVYAFTFTFSMLLGVFYMVQGPLISNLTIVSNTSAKIQQAVDLRLRNMEKFETDEIVRLFNETYDRLRACSYHCTMDVVNISLDIQHKMDSQISNLYLHNKTVYYIVKQALEEKSSILKSELNTFLKDYNATIQRHFQQVLTKYTEFLKSLMRNDWLEFPEEVFIGQKEVLDDNTGMEHMLRFMSWLEVEKVEDTLGVATRVIDR